jgi:hypothetical protein
MHSNYVITHTSVSNSGQFYAENTITGYHLIKLRIPSGYEVSNIDNNGYQLICSTAPNGLALRHLFHVIPPINAASHRHTECLTDTCVTAYGTTPEMLKFRCALSQ